MKLIKGNQSTVRTISGEPEIMEIQRLCKGLHRLLLKYPHDQTKEFQ